MKRQLRIAALTCVEDYQRLLGFAGLGGLIRTQVRSGAWVGGSGLSPGSIVTWRGLGTWPPRGPRSWYSPGFSGSCPGLCGSVMVFS